MVVAAGVLVVTGPEVEASTVEAAEFELVVSSEGGEHATSMSELTVAIAHLCILWFTFPPFVG